MARRTEQEILREKRERWDEIRSIYMLLLRDKERGVVVARGGLDRVAQSDSLEDISRVLSEGLPVALSKVRGGHGRGRHQPAPAPAPALACAPMCASDRPWRGR